MDETDGPRWPGYRLYPVERWRDGQGDSIEDVVAEEVPVVLVYNGTPHVVMLATPLDLEDFARGFTLTEAIVENVSEIESIRVFERSKGIEVRVRIPEARCEMAQEKERNLTGRTGCGLCGSRSLEAAIRSPRPVRSVVTLDPDRLGWALTELAARQRINSVTGAVHAAAWFPENGSDPVVREDVGRHNALDKLIGSLAIQGVDPARGFIVVTSRASFEMVQKCSAAGVGIMAAVSAPTGLAIRLAEEAGLTLIGFARNHNHVIYTHAHRMVHRNRIQCAVEDESQASNTTSRISL